MSLEQHKRGIHVVCVQLRVLLAPAGRSITGWRPKLARIVVIPARAAGIMILT